MKFELLIFFFVALVLTAELKSGDLVETSLFERRRALEKNLLRNLQAHYASDTVKTAPAAEFLGSTDKLKEEDRNYKVMDSGDIDKKSPISKLYFDAHQCILSFLNPSDLLSTRCISRIYRSLSDSSNCSKICQYNPKFVLDENWMNLALSNFLFKYFKNGSISTDELFHAEERILFGHGPVELKSGNYPACFNFLSFIYEYEKGIKSSLPLLPSDLYLDIVSKIPDQDLPMGESILDGALDQFLIGCGFDNSTKASLTSYFKETIRFIASKPSSEAIRAHFNFDPSLPLDTSFLKLLPPFLRIAAFKLILPLCVSVERFQEAIQMASSAFIFSQFLLDQVHENFPALEDEVYDSNVTIFPASQRAFHRKYHRTDVVGLDYLLTRNAANPFNLQELLDMGPNISYLLEEFLPYNTMSLTEADIITQMNEAGLFEGIRDYDYELVKKIDSIISGKIRLKMLLDYADIFMTFCWNCTF